ncbi:Ribosomal protein S18 acetylase RimI [Paramicrobacterium humi]|uniref:Ribosomal protein S18 acetylase RimI n=1 Tax=Paramicrobacterium humi TaxID=640635 RepID=A0A1H4J8Z7_9MICO|nr:GNAT family N-acetyltransferase [Microbacterium humi]SEB42637.1 Ribosomal protein S18 acetylase RimI [Microbacterium humi]
MVHIRRADRADAAALSQLAAQTFALACPPDMAPADVDAFVSRHLSEERFGEYLADQRRMLLVAADGDALVGYTMLVDEAPEDPAVAEGLTVRPSVELSKVYVHASAHGTGAAGSLMRATLESAASVGARGVWLGVNQLNARAVRFYEKSGFRRVGTRRFKVGDRWCDDFVMECVLEA